MTIELSPPYKYGPFSYKNITVTLNPPPDLQGEDLKRYWLEHKNAVWEILFGASSLGRIERWRPHAERLGVGLKDFKEAEGLAQHWEVTKTDRFDYLMAGVEADIENAQNEKTYVPLAIRDVRRQAGCRKGGAAPKKQDAALEAIKLILEKAENKSTRGLWEYFRKNHRVNEAEPLNIGWAEIYFDPSFPGSSRDALKREVLVIDDAKKKQKKEIVFSTFQRYVTEAKKNLSSK